MITNTREMMRAFAQRVKPMELSIDCPMSGTFNAQLAIVAEAPGVNEARQRIPLSGGAGSLMWNGLRRVNVTRIDAYVTNVCKRQLSMATRGNEKSPITRHELDQWKAMLRWELEQLPNVRYVLVLGGVALDACRPFMHTDSEAGVSMWRGSVVEGEIANKPVKFVITYNPAHVLREPKFETTFRFDLGKLGRVLDGKYKRYDIKHHINPSFKEAIQWIDNMQDAKVPVAFDIEVVSDETACIGMAMDDNEGYCINLRTVDANRFSLFEERALMRRLQTFLGDDTVRLVAQNGVFDSSWLWYKDGIRVAKVWYDTLLAHHTLYSSLPHSLAYLTAQYTDHPFYKDEGKSWREGGNIDQFWNYNVKDVCITRRVMQKTRAELQRDGLEDFFLNHVMRLQPHLVRMIVGGVLCDIELKSVVAETLQEDVAKYMVAFHDAVHEATGDYDYNPNPNSTNSIAELLFRKLRLVGRGTSTDADNRKRMRDHPRTTLKAKLAIDALNKYKTEHKFLSTYADSKIDEDNRFRCEYKQFGTQKAPGRLSATKTSWRTGMNLQNQPERSKGMFIADPDYVLIYFDLEQAEARYVGWDAAIAQWKEDFERARLNPGTFDCHRALAAQMWGIPYDEVPKKDFAPDGTKTLRYKGKRCRHGLNYRMGPETLATKADLPYREAVEAHAIYHRITPELSRRDGWWDCIMRMVRTKPHVLYNSYGRRLIVLERLTPEALESIVAFRPQSTIGDKVSRVIYQSHDDDRWPLHARIALNNHDALIGLARPEHAELCLSIMKKYAEEPINITSIVTGETEQLIIPAECKMTTQRTLWRFIKPEKEGDAPQLEFYDDDNGYYRWNNMKVVDVEKAA